MNRSQPKTFRTSAASSRQASLHLAAWLPAFFGVLVICGESTRTMGADHTGVWLARLCSPLMSIADFHLGELNHILRKNGHFFGYGALALGFARGWMFVLLSRMKQTWTRLRILASTLGVLSAAVIASLDEIHQSFLSNRSASAWDVLLDTGGGVLLVTLMTVYVLQRRRRILARLNAVRHATAWLRETPNQQAA